MIEVMKLNKSLDGKPIIKDINFKISTGNIVGLVGPNGAGKSTLLRNMVDIYTPDSGKVIIDGQDIRDNISLKSTIGYVPDKNEYFNKEKVRNVIKYYKLAYDTFDENRFAELNGSFNIPLNQKVEKLSKGNISRLMFMLALSFRPKVLILDEPTSGLDPIAKRKFLKILVSDVSERETTVLISSHNLADLESICDHILFIDNGEIVKDNSLDTLKTTIKKIQVIFKDNAPANFEKWPCFLNVSHVGKSYSIVTNNFNEDLVDKLRENGALFIEELDLSLEDMLVYTVDKNLI